MPTEEKSKTEIFNGENYQEWLLTTTFYLKRKDLATTLNGSPPSDAVKLAAWNKADQQAVGIIGERVSIKFYEQLHGKNTAQQMMEAIHNIAEANYMNVAIRARTSFANAKMYEGEDLLEHLGKLERYRRVLTKKNTNEAGTVVLSEVTDLEMIIRVMDSLPENWRSYLSGLRAQPQVMENYERFKSEIVAENEFRRDREHVSDEYSTRGTAKKIAMYNHTNPKPPRQYRNQGECFNCGKKGHIKKWCFAKGGGKEGQAPWLQEKRQVPWQQERVKQNQGNRVIKSNDKAFTLAAKVHQAGKVKDEDLKYTWILDSGASAHMSGELELFETLDERDSTGKIEVANGDKLNIEGIGKVAVYFGGSKVTITDVLFVPGLQVNLLSVSTLAKKGVETLFKGKMAHLVYEGQKIMEAACDEASMIYQIPTQPESRAKVNIKAKSARTVNINEAHRMMGHLHEAGILKLQESTTDLTITGTKLRGCDICKESKSTRHVKDERKNKTTAPGEEISVDVAFVEGTPVLLLSDTGSGLTMGSIMGRKSEAAQDLEQMVTYMEKQFQVTVKRIISDNGGEFTGGRLKEWTAKKGIKLILTTPYTPEQNGIAERKNRTIMEMTKAMLNDSKLDKRKYWKYALEHAIYIRNRCPTRILEENQTPIEVMTHCKPSLKYLRRFGENCYVYVNKHARRKLDNTGTAAIVLGMRDKGYLIEELKTGRVYQSVHVSFPKLGNNEILQDYTEEIKEDKGPSESESDEEKQVEEQDPSYQENSSYQEDPSSVDTTTDDENYTTPVSTPTKKYQKSQREYRVWEPKDKKAPKQVSFDVDSSNIISGSRRKANMVKIRNLPYPKTNKEALARPDGNKWRESILSELDSLVENGVWEVVKREDLTIKVNEVDSKWVHIIKRDTIGLLDRYKSRLVGKGYSQIEGVDYTETYAPVIRMSSIRLMLSMALTWKCRVTQMDVVTAYLYGPMDTDVYMKVPESYELIDSNVTREKHVLKCKKGIYGLKQSGFLWNQECKQSMMKLGFSQSYSDPGLYFMETDKSMILITIYVDDILVVTKDENLRKWFEDEFGKIYKVKLLGDVHSLLGANITVNLQDLTVEISQENYCKEMGEHYGLVMEGKQMVPMEAGTSLPDGESNEIREYRQMVGSAMYAASVSRPDLAFTTGYLGRFSSKCHDEHIKAGRKLIKYIYNTRDCVLQMQEVKEDRLVCYVDASHISEGGYSVAGYAIFHDKNLISWRSKKLREATISSMESEVCALVEAVKELIWIKGLLMEIGYYPNIVIYEDNQACIAICKKAMVNDRTRHLMAKSQFLRDSILIHNMEIKFVPTKEQLADGFTKPKGRGEFENFRKGLGVRRKDNLDRGSVGMSKLVGSNGNEEPHKEWRQKSRNNGGPHNYAKIGGIELETWNEAN